MLPAVAAAGVLSILPRNWTIATAAARKASSPPTAHTAALAAKYRKRSPAHWVSSDRRITSCTAEASLVSPPAAAGGTGAPPKGGVVPPPLVRGTGEPPTGEAPPRLRVGGLGPEPAATPPGGMTGSDSMPATGNMKPGTHRRGR
eukprot:scaffold584_cov121-Isochrysis_galbana.AAC.3